MKQTFLDKNVLFSHGGFIARIHVANKISDAMIEGRC